MNFDDTPEEAAFRAEARAFLEAHAKPKSADSLGSSFYAQKPTPEGELEHVRECKAWQKVKYDNGWAGLTWPKAYGGRGLTSVQQGIFSQEERAKLVFRAEARLVDAEALPIGLPVDVRLDTQ